MSRIERALRKAEEERLRKLPEAPSQDDHKTNVLVTPEGLTETPSEESKLTQHSEHFRKIAAKLKFCGENIRATDVVFTSAVSGEGKTTNAINCAISLCQDFNLSVCLVDCDLRNPSISKYFRSNGTPGMVEVLKGETDIGSAIQPSLVKGLSIVHSHKVGKHSLSLLNSDRLRRVVQDLRARFDFVLFDTPPILPVADTVVLSRHVSSVVLIVESGKTRRKHIEQILEQIDKDKVIGFIMNYKTHRMPEMYNYSKYYHYGSEGSQNGQDSE
jgi:capsular exopolysaccharide synthesis family protein